MPKAVIPKRIESIDIFRALTMLLMIFVNSLWQIEGAPSWMEHATFAEDKMGLADIVFPCFLFIVGMSVPFAIKSRINKGDSKSKIIMHVTLRSMALLIMGVYHENIYSLNSELTGMSKATWQLLVNISFIFIWNIYPKIVRFKYLFLSLRAIGIFSLITLAIIYKAGSVENPEILKPHWWGILGLIGWTYFISVLIYLYSNFNTKFLVASFIIFASYNVLASANVISLNPILNKWLSFFGNGSFITLTISGIIASQIFIKSKSTGNLVWFYKTNTLVFFATFVIGVITRQFWGISKLNETPAWVFFSISVSFAVFSLLFWLTDVKGYSKHFKLIKPAGTSTLLCYILPYIYNSIIEITGLALPQFFNSGIAGLIKIATIAILIIVFTGVLERINIKMKL